MSISIAQWPAATTVPCCSRLVRQLLCLALLLLSLCPIPLALLGDVRGQDRGRQTTNQQLNTTPPLLRAPLPLQDRPPGTGAPP